MVNNIAPAYYNVTRPTSGRNAEPAAVNVTLSAGIISSVTELFLRDQDVRDASRQLYGRHIRLFFDWINANGLHVDQLARPDIIRYKDELLQSHAPLTVASYLVTVRRFFAWTESLKLYPNVAKGIKTPRRKQEYVKEDLTEYDESTGTWNTDKVTALLEYGRERSPRDYAIISTLIRCGLRTVELTRLNVGDITYKYGQRVLKVWGKGHDGKDDFIVLSEKALKAISAYLKTRGIAGDYDNPRAAWYDEPLFMASGNRNVNGRLSTRSVRMIVKDGLRAIGLDSRQYTAHSLRHTTACLLLENGATLTDAQRVLRHTNPATTEIYVESIKEKQRVQRATEFILDSVI